jgi:hypothetical protein
MDDSIKVSIQLQMPKEQHKPESLMDRIDHAMECLEYQTDRQAYQFLRKVNNCAVKCYNAGKKSPKILEILKKLTPFMAKHGLHDPEGVELANEFVTNPEYTENPAKKSKDTK